MNRNTAITAGALCAATVFTLAVVPRSFGQTAPAPQPTTEATPTTTEEVVKMSPFVVDTTADKNTYRADSTLAGSRVKTDLNDIASSISVVTTQFMKDIGATDNQTLLQYTPNTEVGGVYGNYGGVGSTFVNGASEGSNFLRPEANTRVRGLDSADNTRDYFATNIPWDSYNVDRVDLQRGPNSILFGIGSPAGIINASINTATFKEAYKAENRYGSFGSDRNVLDFNHVLIDNQLAIRVAALDDDTVYRQKPAYNHDKRIFGAVRWEPKLFNNGSSHTSFHASFEYGDVKANRPRILPPTDQISIWFTPAFNKMTWDPIYTQAAAIQASSSGLGTDRGAAYGQARNDWMIQGLPSQGTSYEPIFYYNNLTSQGAPIAAMQTKMYTWGGIDANGTRIGSIGGFPYGALAGIGGFNYYSYYHNKRFPTDPSTLGAQSNFWKDKPITDPSIFDFYNNLIDGPNKKEWQGWDAFNLAFEQTFLNNRLGLEVVYDHQKYHDGSESNLSNPYISVDINANLITSSPWAYYAPNVTTYNGTGTQGTNPNAGAAYIGSNSKNGGNRSTTSTRENIRFTGTGELRATDVLHQSWLTDLLGRHILTGLYSKETFNNENRDWVRYAVDPTYDATIGPNLTGNNGLINGDSNLDVYTYLSGPLFNQSSASGLHLRPVTTAQSPSGTANIQWYNSHWKWPMNPSDPSYVNPAAPWTSPLGPESTVMTQSSNPANYVGWTNGQFRVLNADQGDINSLYLDGTKVQTVTESKALTWQGYLWDDTLAATVGWRRDKLQQRSGIAPINPVLGAASMDYSLGPLDPKFGTTTGNSKTWGVVLHEPKFLRNKLPWGTNISLFYDEGRNTRVETRYGFSANLLPNAQGLTRDKGFIISTLNDRLQLKVTWYDTKVTNANIASVTTGTSTLGSNTYQLTQLEGVSVVSSMIDTKGFANQSPGLNWYWSWAWVDNGYNNAYLDPTSDLFKNDPSTAKEKVAVASALSQIQPQSWWDAYGYKVNVAAAKAGDWVNALPGYNYEGLGAGGLNSSGGGMINGLWPTGTVNNESKGMEYELVGQLTKNWNVSLNSSKQHAAQTALGADLVNFIEAQHAKFQSPAGDLREWWAGDMTLREYYNASVWAAYQFQKGTNGKMVSEMSPWRFNAVTSYMFDHGFLKGTNVGLGYRWQQGMILGYALLADGSNLDVNKPYWGKSQDSVDLWVGYGHKLTDKIAWHIQLNLRSVGQKVRLIPISVEPDGTYAGRRIEEGQTWFVTNTFTF
jgi:outer membrane receptor protein involved in Fe transport